MPVLQFFGLPDYSFEPLRQNKVRELVTVGICPSDTEQDPELGLRCNSDAHLIKNRAEGRCRGRGSGELVTFSSGCGTKTTGCSV